MSSLPVTEADVRAVIKTYQKAWETQDPELITTIFTADATYTERTFEPPHAKHEGIRKYWQEKVVGEQKDISFTLLNVWVCGATAIAEWKATFTDTNRAVRITMQEVAILEFEQGKIRSLREYWQSRKDLITE